MPADKQRAPTNREKQEAHGAQSEQGDRPAKEGPKPEPRVYEGAEESNQQRR